VLAFFDVIYAQLFGVFLFDMSSDKLWYKHQKTPASSGDYVWIREMIGDFYG